MEQASMDDLADMVIKLAKTVVIPESTVFVVGSLSHLSRVGTHGYAIWCVNVRRRLSGAFKGVKVVPFSPPPLGGCNDPELIRNMLDSCIWLAGTPGYPLSETQKVIVDMIMEDEEGEGGLSILISRFSSHMIWKIMRVFQPAGYSGFSAALVSSGLKKSFGQSHHGVK
jgi:hypothetical protein